jgi:hypothetical protein
VSGKILPNIREDLAIDEPARFVPKDADCEPIFRALESLDPTDRTPRCFRAQRPSDPLSSEIEAKKWLDAADGLDYTARILIRYCLVLAADQALDKSQE